MPKTHIRIGTRGSELALWQANYTKVALENLGNSVEIIIIKTKGDKIQDIGFDKMEGKGFFTKEIEEALLNNHIDIAVHSHKDLETNMCNGLKIAAVSKREDPSELLLIRKEKFDNSLKWNIVDNARIGTSSARRKSLLVSKRPDFKILDLRGNVPTRIQKLRDGKYDAIVLAKAGVVRLDISLDDLYVITLDPREFVPAAAQGVLAFQIRESDSDLNDVLCNLNDSIAAECVAIERNVLNLFNGGCQIPLGVYCDLNSVYVSYSKNWKYGAEFYRFDYSDKPNLPAQIVDQVRS